MTIGGIKTQRRARGIEHFGAQAMALRLARRP
jgi:hypothetical protein